MEVFAFGWVFNPFGNDIKKVFGQNERHSFPINAELLFEMAQKVAKVYVKDIAVFIDHDIIWVPVADSQYESGNAISSTRVGKGFNGLFVPGKYRKW